MTGPRLEGRAFFAQQQRRRREAQARLAGEPRGRPTAPTAALPTVVTPTFSPASSGPSPRIRVTSGPLAGQTFRLPPGELIIGRGKGSGIHLDDPMVSHNHAVLCLEGGRLTIEDLRSTNGTKVNGAVIRHQIPVGPGDEIDVGGVQLLVEAD